MANVTNVNLSDWILLLLRSNGVIAVAPSLTKKSQMPKTTGAANPQPVSNNARGAHLGSRCACGIGARRGA